MKIQYDVIDLPQRRGGRRSEVVNALQAFMATQQKNMVLTFDDVSEAKRTCNNLCAFRRVHNLQSAFDYYRVEKSVVILKTKKKGGQSV